MRSEKACSTGHCAALPMMWLLALVAAATDIAALGGVAAMLTMWLGVAASTVVIVVAGVVGVRAVRRVRD